MSERPFIVRVRIEVIDDEVGRAVNFRGRPLDYAPTPYPAAAVATVQTMGRYADIADAQRALNQTFEIISAVQKFKDQPT